MNKIEAIKKVREITQLGLRESKDLVEAITPLVQMEQNEITNRIDSINQTLSSYLIPKNAAYMLVSDIEAMTRLITEREALKKLICNKFHESEG